MKQADLKQNYIPRRKNTDSALDRFTIHITALWWGWSLAGP